MLAIRDKAPGKLTAATDKVVLSLGDKTDIPLKLTRTEWRLFFVLADNAGQIIPHERLLERVWGSEYIGNTEYLKLYIWRLRRKIEQDPTSPKYIITEHGIGHRLSLPASRPNRVA